MKMFKAFTDEAINPFIDGLKTHLNGVTVITSSENGEKGYDDQNLGKNLVSRYVTHGAWTSKLRATKNRSMIENLKDRVFRLEEAIKDIIDFVKQAEKEKQKKKEDDEGPKSAFISEDCLR
ncbi:hypothetical protein P3L10_032250 [Capsicum annuum]